MLKGAIPRKLAHQPIIFMRNETIFTEFSGLADSWAWNIRFSLLKERCHGDQLVFEPNKQNWPTPLSLITLAFETDCRKRLEDPNADER